MKKQFAILSLLLPLTCALFAKPTVRTLLKGSELTDIEIAELPGTGLCINLEDDSLMYLDDPALPIYHLKAKTDTREIIVCDTTIYGSVGNAVYADTCTTPVIILDNDMFRLYPADGSSFYVCTADSSFSSLILVDPVAGAYSVVTEIDAPIRKVVANDTHTFALINDEIVALGANNERMPLYGGEGINDIALSPLGLFIATDAGLYSTSRLSELKYWSKRRYMRCWWIGESLYLLDGDNNLFAIDGLTEQ